MEVVGCWRAHRLLVLRVPHSLGGGGIDMVRQSSTQPRVATPVRASGVLGR